MKRLACLLLILIPATGCHGLMHEMQPHRLWRMNYQKPAGRSENSFHSISDPLDQPIPGAPADDCVKSAA